MRTIDWPDDNTQTYVNGDLAGQVITVDNDHQAIGRHSARMDAPRARELAASHRAVADALEAAADALDEYAGGEHGQPADAPPQAD